MKEIVVASTNPVKVEATKISFEKMFPDEKFEVRGVSAPSNVSDQPATMGETLKGATNRAENVSKLTSDADYWVGIEGGIEDTEHGMEASAYMVVKSEGKLSDSNVASARAAVECGAYRYLLKPVSDEQLLEV